MRFIINSVGHDEILQYLSVVRTDDHALFAVCFYFLLEGHAIVSEGVSGGTVPDNNVPFTRKDTTFPRMPEERKR